MRHFRPTMPLSERIALCNEKVTLNGKPAKITGYGLDFPKVMDLETGFSFEWSWEAVKHVVECSGGAFRS